MALSDDIRSLRDRTLAELNAAHDYYADTIIAWNVAVEAIAAGRVLSEQNPATGTVRTEVELPALARDYIRVQLAQSTFQQFISIFESFVFDLLRLWLTAHPRSLLAKTVDFRTILDAPDKVAITLHVVNREINELMYERPREWFAYLETRARLGCPSAAAIEQFTEAKAARDVIVHNGGVVNQTYVTKAGPLARYRVGELMDIPEPYHRATWELLRGGVADVADAAAAKFPAVSP